MDLVWLTQGVVKKLEWMLMQLKDFTISTTVKILGVMNIVWTLPMPAALYG